MDNLELLYDHYKETFSIIKENLLSRNKFFVMFFVIVFIQFLFAISPDSISSIIINIVKKSYDVDISGQINIIQCLLWIVLLYFTMRYYQSIVYIERQYKYIHSLESKISEYANIKFDRESEDYLLNYPKMNDIIDILYKWFFPIIYCIVITIKIGTEIYNSFLCFTLVLDITIFICCFILTFFYLIFLHKKRR